MDARKTALLILNTLDKKRKTLDRIIEDVLSDNAGEKRDKALLYAIVYGVLRWRAKLDQIIVHFSNTPFSRINPEILNILRIGIFQIVYLDRVPVSAAVNTSVEMAKSIAQKQIAGFVNGMLRSVARGYKKIRLDDNYSNPVEALSAEKSFPKWMIKRWINRLGIDETQKLCDIVNTIPPITIRTNTLKTSRDELIKALEADAKKIEPTNFSSDGIRLFGMNIPIHETIAFKNGWFQVQDEAAQMVTILLNPQPAETILDACAGMGGKTGHIAQIMKNQGSITAMDIDEKKLLRLDSEMERLGISIVKTVVQDIETLDPTCFGMFDRILFDAPCTGIGALRRNPDMKWYRAYSDIARCHKRQINLLNRLSAFVKPCGVLVYVVCSPEPEEGEAVITEFLNSHPEFFIEKPTEFCYPLINSDGYMRTYPHRHGMDAFFAVRLKKSG